MFNFDATYRVAYSPGIAFSPSSFGQREIQEDWELICTLGSECEHEGIECWLYFEPGFEDDWSKIEGHWVGDDHLFIVDVDDLIPIEEDDYCPGCGQIGCTAYQ